MFALLSHWSGVTDPYQGAGTQSTEQSHLWQPPSLTSELQVVHRRHPPARAEEQLPMPAPSWKHKAPPGRSAPPGTRSTAGRAAGAAPGVTSAGSADGGHRPAAPPPPRPPASPASPGSAAPPYPAPHLYSSPPCPTAASVTLKDAAGTAARQPIGSSAARFSRPPGGLEKNPLA